MASNLRFPLLSTELVTVSSPLLVVVKPVVSLIGNNKLRAPFRRQIVNESRPAEGEI